MTLINLASQELKSMMSNRGEGIGINKALIIMSKHMGYRLDPKKLTVLEFFNIRDHYGKENNKIRNSGK